MMKEEPTVSINGWRFSVTNVIHLAGFFIAAIGFYYTITNGFKNLTDGVQELKTAVVQLQVDNVTAKIDASSNRARLDALAEIVRDNKQRIREVEARIRNHPGLPPEENEQP